MTALIDALTETAVIAGIFGACGFGTVIAMMLSIRSHKKSIAKKSALLARRRAHRERIAREQKFCHDWHDTMELAEHGWNL